MPALLLLAAFVAGCSSTRTSWDALGQFSADYTNEDGSTSRLTSSLYRTEGGSSDDRLRMCDLKNVSWGLPGNPQPGRLATIATLLQHGLCNAGRDSVVSGYMVVWAHPAADTTVITGIRSGDWTVTGSVTVTEYIDHDPPDPDIDETVVSETVRGTFAIEAHSATQSVRLENGSFQFSISLRKYRYHPFD